MDSLSIGTPRQPGKGPESPDRPARSRDRLDPIRTAPSRGLLHRASRDGAWLVGVAALLVAGGQLLMLSRQDPPASWVADLMPLVGLIYVGAGLVAWLRRPGSRLGFLMIAGGGTWFLSALVNLNDPAFRAVGTITQSLILAVIVHMLLAFPTGRLHTRPERLVVVAGYGVCLILQMPLYLFAPGGSPLSVADRPDLVSAGATVQTVAGALVVIATGWLIWRRMAPMDPERRRVLAPLTIYGIFALLMMPLSGAIADHWADGGGEILPALQFAIIALVPVGFLVAASRGGFERRGDLTELGLWLGADETTRPGLGDILARTLGDPSLQLLYNLAGEDSLVDGHGVAVATPGPGSRRGMVEVELAGRPVGAILYDSILLDDPEEVRDAGRVIALALDRRRLIVDLRASRSRIATAADDERRRIARDLHDGLQSRLVFLAIQAGTGAPDGTVKAGIESAIDELRELVDGVMPVRLAERGLPAAVRDLADRLPRPVSLEFNGLESRLPPEIETAAYFIVSEAVTNAVKHTDSGDLAVALERIDGHLQIRVDDRGEGGIRDGHGLRGMADRAEALGGELVVESVPQGGTGVRAVIPCGS